MRTVKKVNQDVSTEQNVLYVLKEKWPINRGEWKKYYFRNPCEDIWENFVHLIFKLTGS